ncbi:MAG: hypothetical protein V3U24_05750 [Candidatus Neomarinimicrobiota bacterium]
MKKLLAVLLVVPIWAQDSPRDSSQIEDSWLGFDKIQHVAVSFSWMLSFQYVAVNKLEIDEQEAFPISLAGTALMGLTKEIYDWKNPKNHFSKRDLVANAVGLFLASAVVLTEARK